MAQPNEEVKPLSDEIRAHMAEIGSRGGKATLAKHGKDYFKKIRKLSTGRGKNPLEKMAELITG